MTHSLKFEKRDLRLSAAAPFEVKTLTDNGQLEGYGSIFGNVDAYGDVVTKGAFQKSIKTHQDAGTAPAMLWQHQSDQPIGRWVEMKEDSRGLYVRGALNLETQAGREARALLKQGAISGLSIGFTTPDGGRVSQKDGSYELREVELWEISLVTFPANRQAQVLSSKSLNSRTDLERLLRSAGLPNRAAKKITEGGWSALSPENMADEMAHDLRSLADILRGI